jgi:hypothetical protein
MSTNTAANGLQRHRQSLKEASSERRKNNSTAGWVVQKFGGTSVGKFAVNIAEDIVRFVGKKAKNTQCITEC